ncbi:MAG: gas vesicle protein GvpD [Nanoarchaeota archaeon]|nr:gas vesicle protein GvpD [Nanoarchaeota archaeon]
MGLLKKLKKNGGKSSLVNKDSASHQKSEMKKLVSEVSNLGACEEKHPGNICIGVAGVDAVLYNGIPKKHLVLVAGNAGTGKTVFGLQTANYHASNGKKVFYMSFEESEEQLISHMKGFGWNPEELIKKGNLMIKQDSPYDVARKVDILLAKEKKELHANIKPMILPDGFKPDIFIIDSLTALAAAFESQTSGLYRLYLDRLYRFLKEQSCTCFLISESTGSEKNLSQTGIDEFVVDAVFGLYYNSGEQQTIRTFNVVKVRGTDYRSGKVNFDITSEGIVVYPKIPIDRKISKTEFKNRVSTGISELDKMLQGGYPEGHMIMLSGNTGSGKTTTSMQFLLKGLEKGEKVIYINLEEPTSQILKTSEEHGWDLQKYEKEGRLKFITPDLIDIYPDRILYQILHEVQKSNSTRVVIDSISSIISAGVNRDQLREFLLQLTGYFKTKGITCIMTYLNEDIFGGTAANTLAGGASSELRLSSVVDCIILLRYLERKNSIFKILNILKLRGSGHDKSIREFEITKEGVQIGERILSVNKISSKKRKKN